MKYIAHKTDDGREQTVKEHLEGTARKCRDNAIEPLKEYAYLCGLIHDIGKHQPTFQKRINGSPVRIAHALCGAKELHKQPVTFYSNMLEYCVAGHHTGLPDGGLKTDMPDEPTLHGILKRETEDYSAFEDEISVTYPKDDFQKLFEGIKTNKEFIELYAFFTRYMFSCLTDADFIDTEKFCQPESERGITGDFQEAYNRICDKLDGFKAETPLQKARGRIQAQVYDSITGEKALYAVDMPTGSGKTLCSIRAALKTAIEQGKKRIIYVIPFVSVIEQTAGIFEDIFGDVLPVLQHHSNYDFDEKRETDYENDMTPDKMKRACENWDFPLVVTTNIQFFESMYDCRGSRLRKLHNIADSVIVFDEVHMLPPGFIQPCLRAIGYITKYLNSTAIIMSATMPDFSAYLKNYISDADITYAVKDKTDFEAFKKCRYSYIGKISFEALAERLISEHSALVIVNTKKKARELYKLCEAFEGGIFHLSTNLTPTDRLVKINEIKDRLKNNERTLVISTSLIEAGVDLDFDTVYRENAGIDNILQAGGRCNREGKRDMGEVYVFETDGGYREIQMKSDITRSLFTEFEDISDEECIAEYYKRFFNHINAQIEKNTITDYMGESLKPDRIPFRTYAESFNLIQNDTAAVIIPCKENEQMIDQLRYGRLSVKRNLQKYSVSVTRSEFEEICRLGIIEEISGAWVLSNADYYDREIGLNIESQNDYIS